MIKSKSIDYIFLIFILVTSILCFFIGEAIFNVLKNNVHDVLLIGLYFAFVCSSLIIFTHIIVFFISPIKKFLPSRDGFFKSLITLSLMTFVSSFILGAGFQYLYSVNSISFFETKTKLRNNFIVAIDNSGSMSNSDPDFKRYDALKELFLDAKDDQSFSIYVFDTDSELVMPTKIIEQKDIDNFDAKFNNYKISDGGTNVMGVLEQINIDTNLQKGSIVIVISDGECDITDDTLLKFFNNNVPVNTIGFHNPGGIESLKYISEKTNGEYYNIENVSGITAKLKEITTKYSIQDIKDQTLIEPREDENNTLYIFLRILFLAIIILVAKIFQSLTIDIEKIRKNLLLQSFIFSIVAGFLTEFLFLNTNLDDVKVRYVLVLFATLLFILTQTNQLDYNNTNSFFDNSADAYVPIKNKNKNKKSKLK